MFTERPGRPCPCGVASPFDQTAPGHGPKRLFSSTRRHDQESLGRPGSATPARV